MMPCLITKRSAIKKTARKNSNNKNKICVAKPQYLTLKAPSNNVKLQSDKTLITKMYFFLKTHQMEFFLNETR